MTVLGEKCTVATPYCAPFAAIPRISRAPRLAEMNARPVIQAGSERPDRKKSRSNLISRRARKPTRSVPEWLRRRYNKPTLSERDASDGTAPAGLDE